MTINIKCRLSWSFQADHDSRVKIHLNYINNIISDPVMILRQVSAYPHCTHIHIYIHTQAHTVRTFGGEPRTRSVLPGYTCESSHFRRTTTSSTHFFCCNDINSCRTAASKSPSDRMTPSRVGELLRYGYMRTDA